jgi:hypothetical protein
MGIGPSGNTNHVTITQNAIFDNGRPILSRSDSAGGTTNPASPALLGIDFGVNGVTANDLAVSCVDGFPDCSPPQNSPVLTATSVWSAAGVVVNGTLASRPNQTFTIEFFANHRLSSAGFAEVVVYLVSVEAMTNASVKATFSLSTGADPMNDGSTTGYFSATATNASGSTSEFSAGLQLSKAP